MTLNRMNNDDILKNCKNIFLAVRKFHALQQHEIAKLLGTTQGSISKMENKFYLPEIVLWFNLTKKFKIKETDCFLTMNLEFHL